MVLSSPINQIWLMFVNQTLVIFFPEVPAHWPTFSLSQHREFLLQLLPRVGPLLGKTFPDLQSDQATPQSVYLIYHISYTEFFIALFTPSYKRKASFCLTLPCLQVSYESEHSRCCNGLPLPGAIVIFPLSQ